ncbi:hypothetical protein SAMN05421882_103631 [Nitrosomonas communis]|uniref:Uncharacterized protein n=1 Tax=Nitrosomonas communis TaxID=44574 RepID=A0A1H2XAN4_9PROT|nr:hypothetical protein SAMN05421882_103631 [Nitrosomonas communis]
MPWEVLESITFMEGCTAEALRKRVQQLETDQNIRIGLLASDREPRKQLERKNSIRTKAVNEILSETQHILLRQSSTADRSYGDIYRSAQEAVQGRPDLQANSDCLSSCYKHEKENEN